MTRSRLKLDDFDTPPSKDPAVLREIGEQYGFVSRQPAAAPGQAPAPAADSGAFQRPPRQTGNRNIAINVRVPPDTANKIYALRDIDPTRKQAIADVIEEAVKLLYEREFPNG
jgi:hypothetical protein